VVGQNASPGGEHPKPSVIQVGARQVLYEETKDVVAVLTILRPARRNAMDRGLIEAMRAALLRFDTDPDVAAIVLAGADAGFCAGSDLGFIGKLDAAAMARFEQECADLGRLMSFISKPMIAAVEGFAIGGGFTLATCCDIVVAATGSRWSLPEVPIGWLTPWGLKSLITRVGLVRARNLCFCLEPLSGSEALRIGIADYLTEDGGALARATEIAGKIKVLPRPAVAATKRLFSTYLMQDAEAIDFEANRLFVENCREPVAQATLAKFAAKA
jgi:enoyl-CoA hydratase/carnithine racemase